MLSDRAPTPPRFIGHSTWTSRIGSSPNARGMRSRTTASTLATACSGSAASTRWKSERSPAGAASGIWPWLIRCALTITRLVGRLPEHLREPHDRHGAGADHVGEDLAGADRRQLVDVADEQQRRAVRQRPQQGPHERHVHHAGLVDDQQLAVERVLLGPLEAAVLRVGLEQAVDGLGLRPRWSRSGAWRRGPSARTGPP